MGLAAPLALLALLLVPLIVLLHFIAARWRSREVASLALWEEALRSLRTSLRIRRLLASLALLAEILAVTALAIALARPLFPRRRTTAGEDLLLVLDATASMQARQGRRSRYDEARDRALAMVDALGPGSRMCVVQAARQPRLLAPFGEDRQALRRAITASSATDEAGDPAESLLFVLGLREANRRAEVVFVTDGAFDSLGEADPSRTGIRVVLVGGAATTASSGSAAGNVGITALAFRRNAAGDRELFLSLQSRMPDPVTLPLAVEAGGATVLEREVALAPGETLPLGLAWEGPAEGRVTARIRTGDLLAADDEAYAVLATAKPMRVLLVGVPDPFLVAALEGFPGLRLSRLDRLDPLFGAAGLEEWDLVVFDGAEPPPLGRGRYLLLASVPANLPLRSEGLIAWPRFFSWDRSHPVLAGLSLADVAIEAARRVVPGPGARVIARSLDAPLAVTWEREGLQVLFLAFSPSQSDLPLRAAFPMFVANALQWFQPELLGGEAVQAHPGDPVEITLPGDARAVTVTDPGGDRRTLAAAGSPFPFADTPRVGFYRIEAGGATQDLAVSLCDAAESDLAQRYRGGAAADTAAPAVTGAVSAASVREPIWALFALAALLLIAAEGLFWAEGRR